MVDRSGDPALARRVPRACSRRPPNAAASASARAPSWAPWRARWSADGRLVHGPRRARGHAARRRDRAAYRRPCLLPVRGLDARQGAGPKTWALRRHGGAPAQPARSRHEQPRHVGRARARRRDRRSRRGKVSASSSGASTGSRCAIRAPSTWSSTRPGTASATVRERTARQPTLTASSAAWRA